MSRLRADCHLFLDTANTSMGQIDALVQLGLFRGFIVSLPTPCNTESVRYLLREYVNPGYEIMIPTWGSTVDDMVRNGVALSSMDSKRVIVQVPITTVGIEVASKLVERNIRVCLTGFSNDHHALVAATIGVDYALSNALSVQEAKRVLDALQSKTRILVPVKDFSPDTAHVVEWVKKGYNSFAISPEVARNLVGR